MAASSLSLMALLTMAPSAFATGELPALPRIRTLAALKAEVLRQFGKMPAQDLDALVGWLNRNFFRLEK
jgi:hypothetical protein